MADGRRGHRIAEVAGDRRRLCNTAHREVDRHFAETQIDLAFKDAFDAVIYMAAPHLRFCSREAAQIFGQFRLVAC